MSLNIVVDHITNLSYDPMEFYDYDNGACWFCYHIEWNNWYALKGIHVTKVKRKIYCYASFL